MADDKPLDIRLNEIWRALRKIQSGVFTYKINFYDQFRPYDPNGNGLISEANFTLVMGQLKIMIGLSDFEIKEITDYFRLRDGRVAYGQFCTIVCEKGQDLGVNKQYVTGLEWNDPMHVNTISPSEQRRLCILLSKIAQNIRLKEMVLMPYFQDYEVVAQNVGTVTVPHFSRILHYMKILVTDEDFLLLLKRFMKDSYTVNYVAFVKNVEDILKFYDSKKMLDYSEDIVRNFPGRVIDAALPKIPRPEIGRINIYTLFGNQKIFHPAFEPEIKTRQLKDILLRVQKHILQNSIRVQDFFELYDPLKTKLITKNQFVRALSNMGITGIHRLFLTKTELDLLSSHFEDPACNDLVNWINFREDMDKVFTTKGLDKKPFTIVDPPARAVSELPRVGQPSIQDSPLVKRNLAEDALYRIRKIIENRNIYLHQFFKDFDRVNIGHVSRAQFRQVLYSNGVILSTEEFEALEIRFNDILGFNYRLFLEDADPIQYSVPKFKVPTVCKPVPSKRPCLKKGDISHQDIINAVANCKKQAVVKRVRISDFLRCFDHMKENIISTNDFRRGLETATIHLTAEEMDIICELFKVPLRPNCVNYKQFCKCIEESFYQQELERAPLVTPMQHIPALECRQCFLNFEERATVSQALEKLARFPDNVSNLLDIFKDYDQANCGSVAQHQFQKALSLRDLLNTISTREFAVVCKCFSVERGYRLEVDYRKFLKILDILFANRHRNFY